MKASKLVFLCLLVIIASILVMIKIKNKPRNTQKITLPSQTNSEGSVIVAATLKNTSQPTFEIVLDTHSGSLNEDLTQNAVLTDSQGNIQKPVSWIGDPPGGHHRKGELSFQLFSQKAKLLTLKILNIGGIPERKFIWDAK